MVSARFCALVLLPLASAYQPLPVAAVRARTYAARTSISLDGSIVPPSVWGVPPRKEQRHKLWLDLRTSEETGAQQALVVLFYAVRSIVDGAAKALPQGAGVQGLLFAEDRYSRGDTVGAETLPIFLETAGGAVLSATPGSPLPVVAELRSPTTSKGLDDAIRELNEFASPDDGSALAAIALPADPMLWALALTGFTLGELVCVDEGA